MSFYKRIFLCLLFVTYIKVISCTIQAANEGANGVVKEVMAGRQLYVYSSYKEMQIFHFSVPPLTTNVIFTFVSNESSVCDPRNVTMYLTPGSYPVVAPLGETFPSDLWVDRGVKVYHVDLKSDEKPVSLSVQSPVPGPWFIAGAVMEDTNRITQAGLVPDCQFWIKIEASYSKDIEVFTLLPSLNDQPQPPTLAIVAQVTYYRFYVGPYGFTASVQLTNCSGSAETFDSATSYSIEDEDSCPIILELTPLSISHHSSNHSTILNCLTPSQDVSNSFNASDIDEFSETKSSSNERSVCGVDVIVMEDAWHYIKLTPLNNASMQLYISVSLNVCNSCAKSSYSSSLEENDTASSANVSPELMSHNSTDDIAYSIEHHNITNVNYDNSNNLTDVMLNNTYELEDRGVFGNDKDFIGKFSPATNFDKVELKANARSASENLILPSSEPLSASSPEYDSLMLNSSSSSLHDDSAGDGLNNSITYKNDQENSAESQNETFIENRSKSSCWNRHDLVRKTFAGNFRFEYDLAPSDNGSVPLMVNVSVNTPTLLAFSMTPFMDLGGTLSIELALYPFLNTSIHHYQLTACLSSMIRVEPQHGAVCEHGYTFNLNTSSVNGLSSLENVAASVLVPFPDPGPWYISIKVACYRHINITTNSSTTLKSITRPTICTSEDVATIFSISSSPCIRGSCGRYGACYQYIYSGYIFSTCICDAGYRGWGCTDSSEAIPDSMLLLATLLLTLSNLAFLPAIVLAVMRRHYTEGLVYTCTMVFSTLYHACDQETYNWCLMKVSVLQFCDFYSAILAFWVTVIAMADLPRTLVSVLHMAGAVLVALGVEYNRTGLWVFMVPALASFAIMAVSWGVHTKDNNSCYPPRSYWLFHLLPGALLAAVGLICYAFLETYDNYQYVHSAWHATMALAILCILPPKRPRKKNSHLLSSDTSDCAAAAAVVDAEFNGNDVL